MVLREKQLLLWESQAINRVEKMQSIRMLNKLVHIFILVINQLDAQNLFYNKFISCLNMFRAPCAHRQEVKNCIIQHLVSSHL